MNNMLNTPLMKGALVSIPTLIPIPKPILFQYNPETLSRSIDPSVYGGQNVRGGPVRYSGAPNETIELEILLDSIGSVAGYPSPEPIGVRPLLASLELLLYPNLAQVVANEVLIAAGTVEALPISANRTLFVFGPTRVVPVRLTGMKVTEQFFDQSLNPIRATVALTMNVVTYSDVYPTDPDYALFVAHQTVMEVASAIYVAGEAESALSDLGL